MPRMRVPPLPVALALVAAALIATVWTTRTAIDDAYDAVRDGQAFAAQQGIRADLADLGAAPDAVALATIVRDRASDGVRYVGLYDGQRLVVEAGTHVVADRLPRVARRGGMKLVYAGSRVRVEVGEARRRGARTPRLVVELDADQARALEAAANRTVAIGGVAAAILLLFAGWLVRVELRRRAQEQQRERERRLASLGEMSAVLAHEIRNPLASLKGNAQLLAASLPEGEKPRAKAERVVDEAIRLERLTQDLLAFVRTGEISRARVEPAALARTAAAAVQGEVIVEVAGEPATWSLDEARMQQVLVNLLENAIAAGPPVTLSVASSGDRLVIEVSDRGPGIAVENREKVFEPFFTSSTRGTGLGLAIARRIIEQHRGTITAGEAPGGGARFRIEIPEND